MYDPLLTIDDVTREFHVSPKSVRRRLVAGEVPGAYKRPGANGPEWVMLRSAFASLGYPARESTTTSRPLFPDELAERAQYWEQRARAAEALLADGTSTTTRRMITPARKRAVKRWAAVAVGLSALLLLAIVATLLVTDGGGTSSVVAPPAADDNADRTTIEAIAALSAPGDTIGYADVRTARLVPSGRIPVAVRPSQLTDPSADVPRMVIVEDRSDDAIAVADALGDQGAEIVYEHLEAGVRVSVFRRVQPEPSRSPVEGEDGAAEPRVGDAADQPGPVGAAPDVDDAPVDDAPNDEGPLLDDAPGDEDGADVLDTTPETGAVVTVLSGDNFWDLSEAQVTDALGRAPTNAEIAAYWTQVLDANADRLVEPGNFDLILVGQSVVLPPI